MDEHAGARAGTDGPVGRVLVVEDDPTLGGGLVAGLAGAGHEVRWARDAAAATALLATSAWDLVLLDLGPARRGRHRRVPRTCAAPTTRPSSSW